MIRNLPLVAIGMALVGAHARSSLAQGPSTPAAAGAPAAATTAAENAVRETLNTYVAAYNQKDAAKLVELFTQEGTLIDPDNVATRGREAIAEEFADAFADRSTYTLEAKIERIRLITSDVAQAEGQSRLESPKEATIANQFVVLLARQNEVWKIVEIREYPAPADSVTPYERLKELEWMVGEWVDESEDVQISSTVRWGRGKAYLVRDYSVQVKGEPATSGLMIIAVDSQTDQIKSWIFNADGSRGEGTWTRATENQWVVKAHGSTGDGQPTSATQIISLVNKDVLRTSSTDRIVGGEIAGDIDDVIMVRKPPAPGTTRAQEKPATAAPARTQSQR
jgi:uncharacterized protein (TIGR02246 family)